MLGRVDLHRLRQERRAVDQVNWTTRVGVLGSRTVNSTPGREDDGHPRPGSSVAKSFATPGARTSRRFRRAGDVERQDARHEGHRPRPRHAVAAAHQLDVRPAAGRCPCRGAPASETITLRAEHAGLLVSQVCMGVLGGRLAARIRRSPRSVAARRSASRCPAR